MWTMKCAVVCAWAGMVCTVAAASGEAYNGGFGGELARCTGGTDAAAPREGGELGVGGRWPGTEAHDAPHAARRLREGRGSRVLTEAWRAGYGAAGAQGRTPCAGIGTGERDRRARTPRGWRDKETEEAGEDARRGGEAAPAARRHACALSECPRTSTDCGSILVASVYETMPVAARGSGFKPSDGRNAVSMDLSQAGEPGARRHYSFMA